MHKYIPVDLGVLGVKRVEVIYNIHTNPNGSSWDVGICEIFWGPVDLMQHMASDDIDKVSNAVCTLIELESKVS